MELPWALQAKLQNRRAPTADLDEDSWSDGEEKEKQRRPPRPSVAGGPPPAALRGPPPQVGSIAHQRDVSKAAGVPVTTLFARSNRLISRSFLCRLRAVSGAGQRQHEGFTQDARPRCARSAVVTSITS
jgi:hypothetical protein